MCLGQALGNSEREPLCLCPGSEGGPCPLCPDCGVYNAGDQACLGLTWLTGSPWLLPHASAMPSSHNQRMPLARTLALNSCELIIFLLGQCRESRGWESCALPCSAHQLGDWKITLPSDSTVNPRDSSSQAPPCLKSLGGWPHVIVSQEIKSDLIISQQAK